MKRLILLRHGEAGFSASVDFQRKLTPHGKDKLIRLGENLPPELARLDFLYCSTAIRTKETAEIIKNYIKITEETYLKEIYDGNLEGLLELLEKMYSRVSSCILIGHNPTISALVSHLTKSLYIGLLPGMMAVIDLDISDWSLIGMGMGTLRELRQ